MRPITARARRVGALGPLAVALLAASCGREQAAEESGAPVVNASTGPVVVGPFRETISAIGTVVPRPGQVALLSAPAPTRVARVYAVVGQRVAKGAPLVEFERAPFDARAASAEVALQAAEQAQERAHRLVAQGIAARKDEEQAAADLARARAGAVEARREAQLARLDSPIDGVVTRMAAVLGASVDQSQPMVEVADPAAVDVVANVMPAEAARIRAGARATLASAASADGESLGTTAVRDVGGAVDPDTRGIVVRLRGGTTKRPLRIGESVVAEITVAEYAKAVLVPGTALVPDGEGFKVFVVGGDGTVHEQPVTVGGRTKTTVRITGGLMAGQIVVTDGAFGMTDGARIAHPPAGGQKAASSKAP